jgi:mannosyltransferase
MRHKLLWLCIFALALRLVTLGASLLWYDEAFTATIVKLPLFQALQAVRGDVHPPLWYAVEWLMIRLGGNNAFALRLPAALFGVASVAELFGLVKRLAGERAATWAGALLAVMPGQLYYSQEARMYSLLTLLALLGARAVLDRNWLRLGLTLPLILYTQNIGIVYAALLGGWALWTGRKSALRMMGLGAVSYLPWVPTAVRQVRQVDTGFWLSYRDSLGAPLYSIPFTTVFTRLPDQFYIHAILLSLLLTGLALYGLRAQISRCLPLVAGAFAPPLILYVISLVWRPVLLDRALLPAGAALVGLWGAGLSTYSGWGRKALAALALPIAAAALVTFYTDPTGQRPATDPIAQTVRDHFAPGDCLYHITLESTILYNYYLPDLPAYTLPEAGDLAQSLTDETKAAMLPVEQTQWFTALPALGCRRAFLFVVTNPVTSKYEEDQAAAIQTGYHVIDHWVFLDEPISKFVLVLVDPGNPAVTVSRRRPGAAE